MSLQRQREESNHCQDAIKLGKYRMEELLGPGEHQKNNNVAKNTHGEKKKTKGTNGKMSALMEGRKQ